MDEFQSEKEQIEEIRQWWKKNGSFIITGVILGVAVLGGWQYWKGYKEQRASAASAYYEELTQAIGRDDRDGAADLMSQLASKFEQTPYYSQAALAMAKLHVQSSEPEQAIEQLRSVLVNSADENIKLVARLRLARVQLSAGFADEALATLGGADPGSFSARFHEVRGDAYAALGRTEDARIEYTSALDQYEPGLFDQQMVEMKLDDLAVADGASSFGIAPVMAPETAPDIATDMPDNTATEAGTDSEPDTASDIEPGA